MTIRTCLGRAGKSSARRIAVLLVGVLVVGACDAKPPAFVVKAVAVGVPSLAPFFDEDSGLGDDAEIAAQDAVGGLQQGNTPGLYGGTTKATVCDIALLKEFLTDPKNVKKSREWARVVKIDPSEIEEYLDTLTPVLLRHDTLVRNHDYKKGRAVAFDALLEAGIAVLVDRDGLPAVKCSCGNPLRPFDKDPENISVEFTDGSKKWDDYVPSALVSVKAAPQPLKRIALVDVREPDRGISRAVGSAGEDDKPFDAAKRQAVPDLTGMTVDAAVQLLVGRGLAATFSGAGAPPGDARVSGSDPGPGTELRFGTPVTLNVDRETTGVSTPAPEEKTPPEGNSTDSPTATSGGTTDEGTAGKGTVDDGATNEGATDGGAPEGDATKSGSADGGATDGGTADGGTTNGGTSDGGTSDGGTTGGSTSNGGSSNGGTTTGSTANGGTTDGGAANGGADSPAPSA
ncbi:PASTA domain-containing protein, partial [Streptomyces acidicola]